MNVGLFEAGDLARAIARVIHAPGSAADELKQYNNRWLGEWRRLEGLDAELQPQAGADPWVRNNASRLMPCLPAHGIELEGLAAQLRLDVAQLCPAIAGA